VNKKGERQGAKTPSFEEEEEKEQEFQFSIFISSSELGVLAPWRSLRWQKKKRNVGQDTH